MKRLTFRKLPLTEVVLKVGPIESLQFSLGAINQVLKDFPGIVSAELADEVLTGFGGGEIQLTPSTVSAVKLLHEDPCIVVHLQWNAVAIRWLASSLTAEYPGFEKLLPILGECWGRLSAAFGDGLKAKVANLTYVSYFKTGNEPRWRDVCQYFLLEPTPKRAVDKNFNGFSSQWSESGFDFRVQVTRATSIVDQSQGYLFTTVVGAIVENQDFLSKLIEGHDTLLDVFHELLTIKAKEDFELDGDCCTS